MIKKLITQIRRLFIGTWEAPMSAAAAVDELDRLSKKVDGSMNAGGLCWQVGGWLVKKYAPSWKHFSGSALHPVPHHLLSPRDAFTQCSKYAGTEYGRKRRDLARHMRDCVIRDYGHLLEGEGDA